MERFPPEYKNSDTHWDFFFNSMCTVKTKSWFLTLCRLEQSATYQRIFRNLTKVEVPFAMCAIGFSSKEDVISVRS